MPSRVSDRAGGVEPHHSRLDKWGERRPIQVRRVDTVARADVFQGHAFRQPDAGEQRLFRPRPGQGSDAGNDALPGSDSKTIVGVVGMLRQWRDRLRVACAPQPKASQSPSAQDFTLWRDSWPGRATFEIS